MNNRELKFRAFYENKLYMQEYCGGFSYFIHNESTALSLESVFIAAESGKCIIQQYTGLKDKNGKEIYEGDIVTYQQPYRSSRLTHPATTDSYRTIKAPVIYNQDDFTYEIDRYALGTSMIKTRKDIEVIGNIFENPELIKNDE